MKILVTGSTGKVGSVVLKELVKRGAEVRVLVRKKNASTEAFDGADGKRLALKDFSDDPEQNGLDRIATAPTQVATASGSYQHVGARGPVSNKSQDQEEEYQEPQDAQAVQNEGAGSHVKPVPDIALLDTPREILANSLDGKTRDAVIANHRDAMHRMLRVPSNDRISRTIMSPRISPDDATSFNGMDL